MKSIYQLMYLQCLILLIISHVILATPPYDVSANRDKRNSVNMECGESELFSECGGCERTCDDVNNDSHSGEHCKKTLDCFGKCVCKTGYIREKEDGQCIRIQECPRVKH